MESARWFTTWACMKYQPQVNGYHSICSFHHPAQARASSISTPSPVDPRMCTSCHQPPFEKHSYDCRKPIVGPVHSCGLGRGLRNTLIEQSASASSRHTADPGCLRTGVVKIIDVNGFDIRDGCELKTVDRVSYCTLNVPR